MTEYHIFKRFPGFLYEYMDFWCFSRGSVGCQKYFWSGSNVKCGHIEVNWGSGNGYF